MQIYSKEDIARAREMDLLTYLTYYDPGNLKHVSGNTYCTREHDSLIINNGKWCWFSQGIGGRCALDYLRKVKGLSFYEAVDRIIGNKATPLPPPKPIQTPPKVFVMPEISDDTTRVRKYLTGRGIDPEIVDWCIKRKLIYETAKYGNVLFVGYDSQGLPKYGAVRSTSPKSATSTREVCIPELLCDKLKAYKAIQDKEIAERGSLYNDEGYILTQFDGSPIHGSTFREWTKKVFEFCEVPYVTVHGLRHTYASLLICSGTDPRTAAAQLGHSSPSLTMNIYANPQNAAKRKAGDLIGNIMGGKYQ